MHNSFMDTELKLHFSSERLLIVSRGDSSQSEDSHHVQTKTVVTPFMQNKAHFKPAKQTVFTLIKSTNHPASLSHTGH